MPAGLKETEEFSLLPTQYFYDHKSALKMRLMLFIYWFCLVICWLVICGVLCS